jgi:hypothetical protein
MDLSRKVTIKKAKNRKAPALPAISVGVQQRVVVYDESGTIIGQGYTRTDGYAFYVEDLVDALGVPLPPGAYQLQRTDDPERLIVIPKSVQ